MALLSFADSSPRAYRLKVGNASLQFNSGRDIPGYRHERVLLGRGGSLHAWDSVQFTELLTLAGRRRVTKVRRIECEPHFM